MTSSVINNTPNEIAPGVKPGVQPATIGAIPSNLPGGSATTLNDYYSSKGQTLPAISSRAGTFAQLGLGSAADYTGSAQQNEELLSALQRKDYSATTLGTPTAGANAGALSSTPAGVSLSAALAGGDAATTLANYRTYLSAELGIASSNLSTDESALNSFFSTEQSPDSILQSEMDRAGVTSQQSVLGQLDAQIAAQTKTLANLPDDIRSTLADAGVSQAQLDRLTAKETAGPTKALSDLMTSRNATATEIDKAMTFAKQFADTRIAAQAAKLSALEWQVTSDKGDYKNLSDEAQKTMMDAINERKGIMTAALDAAKNGAGSDVIDKILHSNSYDEAFNAAGDTLVKPKPTAATTAMTKELQNFSGMFETGYTSPNSALIHFNGRGTDGFVDPNLYNQQYQYIKATYGNPGIAAFFKKFPPAKNVNPAAVGSGELDPVIENLVTAGQKKTGTIS